MNNNCPIIKVLISRELLCDIIFSSDSKESENYRLMDNFLDQIVLGNIKAYVTSDTILFLYRKLISKADYDKNSVSGTNPDLPFNIKTNFGKLFHNIYHLFTVIGIDNNDLLSASSLYMNRDYKINYEFALNKVLLNKYELEFCIVSDICKFEHPNFYKDLVFVEKELKKRSKKSL